jgi:mannosyltransferase OCH1-like enzyme
MLIPRLVHQTVESPKQLLKEYDENRNYLAAKNPEWFINLYFSSDREDFIRTNYDKQVISSYLSIDEKYGAARADFFRYLVVYHEGGLYLDIKSTALKPLNSVILPSDSFVTAQWPQEIDGVDISGIGIHKDLPFPEYQNWFILAAPKNIILENVITGILRNLHNYNPITYGVGKRGVLRTTGPLAYSQIIHTFVQEGLARLSTNDELGLRPTVHKIESSENPFPNRQENSHYSDLRIPIVRKSEIHSYVVDKITRIIHKLKKIRKY